MASEHSNQTESVTHGVRVGVTPFYVPQESKPEIGKWIFAYRIVIANDGDSTVQLMSRHWVIIDADGEKHEVRGEGVIGHQPVLKPGQEFEYMSFCPLETEWGTMEGEYQMMREDGWMFEAKIGRFYLTMDAVIQPLSTSK